MRLNIYNIFPTCYLSFKEIYKDLERIKAMGFDAIWLNSFLEAGFKNRSYAIAGKQQYYLLNLADLKTQLSQDKNEVAIKWVQRITKKALELGLTPMFDLVLNYVSMDFNEYKKDIGKKTWLFETSQYPKFNDVVSFNYEEKFDLSESKNIFKSFLQEKIDWFIDALGFRGVRVESIACTNPDILAQSVTYIATKLKHEYKIEAPVILGEFVGDLTRQQEIFPTAEILVTMKEHGAVVPFDYLVDSANELRMLDYGAEIASDPIEASGAMAVFGFDSILYLISVDKLLPQTYGGNKSIEGFLA